jgi:hypothetical protein
MIAVLLGPMPRASSDGSGIMMSSFPGCPHSEKGNAIIGDLRFVASRRSRQRHTDIGEGEHKALEIPFDLLKHSVRNDRRTVPIVRVTHFVQAGLSPSARRALELA